MSAADDYPGEKLGIFGRSVRLPSESYEKAMAEIDRLRAERIRAVAIFGREADELRVEVEQLRTENARLQDQVTIKTSDLSAATRMQLAALHDALNVLRQESANARAERDVLRQALVRWKRRQPITTWEYIEFVLNLIPDDDWGIEEGTQPQT